VRRAVAADADVESGTPAWLRLAPVAFLLLWSAGFPVAKIGVAHAEPMTFLALRYAAVLVVLAPLALLLRPPFPAAAAAWTHLIVIGVLIQGVYFGLSYVAFASGGSAGAVALVISLQPILVALLAPRLAGERIGWSRWLGLGLGLCGATLVIIARSVIEATSPILLVSAAGALLGMTAAALYEKRFGVSQHPVTANVVQYGVGLALVFPLAWAQEPMTVVWTPGFVAALGYLVIGNSLIALTLLLAMIRHGEVARVSALFFLVPPTAALIAWAMIGEAMPPLGWLGMSIAAAGVALVSRPPANRHP
jgi:drug/metabolite transporter (DMT)-like permease